MRSTAAARRYARALFSLAQELGDVATVRTELTKLSELLDSHPELHAALFRPLHPVAERRAVLVNLCRRQGISQTVRNFLVFLVDQRRLVDFDGIRQEYERLADEAAGLVRAEVVCAGPLSDSQRERLQRALSARTGRDIELEVRVDGELIGGAVAKVGGIVFDGSLRTQLFQLHDSLTRGQ